MTSTLKKKQKTRKPLTTKQWEEKEKNWILQQNDTQHQNKTLASQIDTKDIEIQQLQQQLLQAQIGLQHQALLVSSLEAKRADQEQQISNLQGVVSEAKEELAVLKATAQTSTDKLREQHTCILEHEARSRRLSHSVCLVRDTLDEVKKENHELSQKLFDKQISLETLSKEQLETQNQLEEVECKVENLLESQKIKADLLEKNKDWLSCQRAADENALKMERSSYESKGMELVSLKNELKFRTETLEAKINDEGPSFGEINSSICQRFDSFLNHITEHVSDKERFKGYETLRWKSIRSALSHLRGDIQSLTKHYEMKDNAKAQEIEVLRDSEAMLSEKLEAVSERFGETKMKEELSEVILGEDGSGRLCVSKVRREEIMCMLGSVTRVKGDHSEISLMCCRRCGVFFLDSDDVWSVSCLDDVVDHLIIVNKL